MALPQAYVPPPHERARVRVVTDTPSSSAPGASKWPRAPGAGRRKYRQMKYAASSAKGRFTKNTLRQPRWSVRKPPTSGPTTELTPHTAPV